MEDLYELIKNAIESAISSHEDRVMSAIDAFRKDVHEELALLQQLVKPSVPILNDTRANTCNSSQAVSPTDRSLLKSAQVFQKKRKNVIKLVNSNRLVHNLKHQSIASANQMVPDQEEQLLGTQSSVIKAEVFKDMHSALLLPEEILPIAGNEIINKEKEHASIVDVSQMEGTMSSSDNEASRLDESQTMLVEAYNPNNEFPVPVEIVVEEEKLTTELHLKGQLESTQTVKKKRFQCIDCDKTFSKKSTLKDHMNIHTKEKQFKCLICGKVFHQKISIKHHVYLHHAERKHKCEHCGKMFTTKSALRRHIMSHTGEKPFQCTKCEKRFSRRGYIRIHARHCTGNKSESVNGSLENNWVELSSEK